MLRQSVLVVEDDVIVRIGIADDLRAAGYDVTEAATAAEALGLIDSGRRFGVIFSDIRMPGRIDGLGLAHIVQRDHSPTKVILTTGSDAGYDLAGRGGLAFIWKPYRAETVIAAVKHALNGTGTGQEDDGLRARP